MELGIVSLHEKDTNTFSAMNIYLSAMYPMLETIYVAICTYVCKCVPVLVPDPSIEHPSSCGQSLSRHPFPLKVQCAQCRYPTVGERRFSLASLSKAAQG